MKKLSIILGVIISLGIICGGVYRFDCCKASKKSVIELAGNFQIYKLEQYRRYLQERIWTLQNRFPNSYQTMHEYRRLVEEMRQIDTKINAFYQRRGG